jgi:hypothetical protein
MICLDKRWWMLVCEHAMIGSEMLRNVILVLGVCLVAGHAPGAQARSRVGRVRVLCAIDGASVFINGRIVGATPLKKALALSPGTYQLTIKKVGYREVKRKVKIRSTTLQQVSMKLTAVAGVLSATSNVSGAKLWVDGRTRGRVPYEGELKPGIRNVEIRASGYSPFSKRVKSVAGRLVKIKALLRRSKSRGGRVEDTALTPLVDLVPLPVGDAQQDWSLVPDLAPLSSQDDKSQALSKPALVGLETIGSGDQAQSIQKSLQESLKLQTPKPWWTRWYTIAGVGLAVGAAVALPLVLELSKDKVNAVHRPFELEVTP